MTAPANPRVPRPLPVEGRRALVVGAGRSGLAAACLLRSLGATVTVSDLRSPADLSAETAELAALGAELVGDARDLTGLDTPDLAVVSPGVKPTAPMIAALKARGVPILGEMELAWQHCPARVAAVTGTNGKGTTCRLAHAMLRQARAHAVVAGNIGAPLSGLLAPLAGPVDPLSPESIVVLEVSSFQLMTTSTFAPDVAAVLNLSPDHLDWHRDMAEYAAAKRRIFAHQRPEDLGIVVTDDPGAAGMLDAVVARRARVAEGGPAEVTWTGEAIRAALPGREETLVPLPELAEWGRCHRLDALVAAAIALWLGAPAEHLRAAVAGYEHPDHLMTEVALVGGVRYVDDSKATNVSAALADLDALAGRGPLVVITGGKDKGVDLRPWAEALATAAKAVVAIGETADKLAALMPQRRPLVAPTLADAVRAARAAAADGDTVALIPACSSFDMFDDYADRGQRFAEAVLAATGKQADPREGGRQPWPSG